MTIQGQVIDSKTGAGLPSASVILTDRDFASLGIGTKADENGYFSLTDDALDDDSNIVNFSYVGYGGIAIPPSSANGKISMAPATGSLEEIVVTAKKRIKQIAKNYNWYYASVAATVTGAVVLMVRFYKGLY